MSHEVDVARRIPVNQTSGEPLKQVAGLLKKLSYGDMMTLGAILGQDIHARAGDGVPVLSANITAEALLLTADNILKQGL